MSDELVGPTDLAIGGIYADDEGIAWAVVGRDERGAALLGVPADVPDWGGLLLETDGALYDSDRFVGYLEGLRPTGRTAACRSCGAPLVASPGSDPANHRRGCAWLKLLVRAVARGVASPSGRWLRAPTPGDLVPPG